MRITGKNTRPISNKSEIRLLHGSCSDKKFRESLESKGKKIIDSDHIITK